MRLLSAFVAVVSLFAAFGQAGERHLPPRAGDNLPATQAEINDPLAITVDGSKILYIAEITASIRRVDLKSGIITTLKTRTRLTAINSLAVDTNGNLIATEFTVDRVRGIDPTSGTVTTIAGGRRLEFSGDGGPAINAGLNQPSAVTVDTAHNIYLADTGNSRIRRVDAQTGIITTVAGSGKRDSSGDGGPALDAGLEYPNSVAVDTDGSLFIAQYGSGRDSHRIRRVDAKTGIITTVAGVAKAGLIGDGLPAHLVNLEFSSNLLLDPMGDLYLVDGGNDRVRCIDPKTQIIRTVAGSSKGLSGDKPSSIAMDSDGNLFFADFENHRIRRVDARTGVTQTVAGNGLPNHPHIYR